MAPRKRRRKKKSHPDKPKKGMSAFMLFCKDHRAKVRQEKPELTFGQIGKQLGDMWRNLDQERKDQYQRRSADDKLRAQKLLARWYETHPATSSESEEENNRRRRKKDPNAPKGPISAYFFFCRERRPMEKAKHPDITFTELGKSLGAMWKQLSPAQRQPFVQLAAQDKERYDREKEEYDRNNPKPIAKAAPRRAQKKRRRKQESSSDESSSDESSSEESSSEESSSESESD